MASAPWSHMATTSLTLVGHSAGSPAPLLRPLPATGQDAEILGVEDPYVGYDAETCPSQQPPRQRRSTSRAGRLGGVCGHMSRYSIVRIAHACGVTGGSSSGGNDPFLRRTCASHRGLAIIPGLTSRHVRA